MGTKPLTKLMLTQLFEVNMHTGPQWVNLPHWNIWNFDEPGFGLELYV